MTDQGDSRTSTGPSSVVGLSGPPWPPTSNSLHSPPYSPRATGTPGPGRDCQRNLGAVRMPGTKMTSRPWPLASRGVGRRERGGLAVPDAAPSPALTGANGLFPSSIYAAAVRAGVRCVVTSVRRLRRGAFESSLSQNVSGRFRLTAVPRPSGKTRRCLLSRCYLETAYTISHFRATSVQDRTGAHLLFEPCGNGPLARWRGQVTGRARSQVRKGIGDRRLAEADDAPSIVLQPWEGLTARSVLKRFGGTNPLPLPAPLCRGLLWRAMQSAARYEADSMHLFADSKLCGSGSAKLSDGSLLVGQCN